MSLELKRSCYAYIRFCSLLPFNRRLRPDVLHARRARRRGRLGAQLSALQYRAERRERLSRLGRSRRGHRRRSFDTNEEKTGDVLYKGIAERAFERSFQLADHVVVKDARLENGLLHVDLVREIPEAMKPRAIPIASSRKVLEVQPTKVAA